ncbi:MAG: hypothetical protein ACFFCP_11675 [Promethearchaeota archaeon]
MTEEIGGDTSHPDIDSALEMHLGTDFSYKTKVVDGETIHQIMRLKKGQWTLQFTVPDEDVRTFDNEEMATYLIHYISRDRAIKRRLIGIVIAFLVIAVPIFLFSYLVLGIGVQDDFQVFLIVGGTSVVFISVFCIVMSSVERTIDRRVYSSRSNFIDMLQKMMDQAEEPYEKGAIEQRIRRLEQSYQIDDV